MEREIVTNESVEELIKRLVGLDLPFLEKKSNKKT
jgi:outer membrane biogenesis lipoprotein LolB